MAKRTRKNAPSSPEEIAARRRAAREAELFANAPEPRLDEGPSARLLRQMIRLAQPEPAPLPEPEFTWSESQLKRMARAETKMASKDRREVARGVAEMAALTAEKETHLDRRRRERAALETIAAAEARGEELDAPPVKSGETVKPMRRRTGLEWLRRKDRISDVQTLAGQAYADDYRTAQETPLKSCLAETRGGKDDLNGLEAREEAYQRLKAARAGALSGHSGMISICDFVCGEGRTIRQLVGDNDAEAQQAEARLCIALDLLADHYGIKDHENRIRVSHWG